MTAYYVFMIFVSADSNTAKTLCDCSPMTAHQKTNKIIFKFADDTKVLGQIDNSDKTLLGSWLVI